MHCHKHLCTNEARHTIHLVSPGKQVRLFVTGCCDQHLDNWLKLSQDGNWKAYLDRSLLMPANPDTAIHWEQWSLEIISPAEITVQPAAVSEQRHRKINLDNSVYCQWDTEVIGGRQDCDHDFDPEPYALQPTYIEFECTLCGQRVQIGVWE